MGARIHYWNHCYSFSDQVPASRLKTMINHYDTIGCNYSPLLRLRYACVIMPHWKPLIHVLFPDHKNHYNRRQSSNAVLCMEQTIELVSGYLKSAYRLWMRCWVCAWCDLFWVSRWDLLTQLMLSYFGMNIYSRKACMTYYLQTISASSPKALRLFCGWNFHVTPNTVELTIPYLI